MRHHNINNLLLAACQIHEGSALTRGTKYIMRTDVLYSLADSKTKQITKRKHGEALSMDSLEPKHESERVVEISVRRKAGKREEDFFPVVPFGEQLRQEKRRQSRPMASNSAISAATKCRRMS
eukprot:SAG31_NODE_4082_length_3608_cov_2.026788_3_plen_123_part_00